MNTRYSASKNDLIGVVIVVGIVASFVGGIALAFELDDARWLFLSLSALIILSAG